MAKRRGALLRRALLLVSVAALLVGGWLLAVWPAPSWYRSHWPTETAFMAMRRAQRADAGKPPKARRYQPVPLARIAPAMREAVIVGEDQNFRRHGGLDYAAIRAALGYRGRGFAWSSWRDDRELLRVLGGAWSRRAQLRGASTITQQLAKNLYLSPSRNPLRKVKEAVTAWRLERALGKDRILELYLNSVELGDEVWGVEAASRRYFGHDASTLSRAEAAALAATLPFPLTSNPAHRPARMRRRQALILRGMRGERVVIPKEREELEATPPPPPADSAAPGEPAEIDTTPGVDSLLDSLRAPVETLPPDTAAGHAEGTAPR